MTRTRTTIIILDEFNNNKQKIKALQKDVGTLLTIANNTDNIQGLIEILEKIDIYEKRMLELASEQGLLVKEYNSS